MSLQKRFKKPASPVLPAISSGPRLLPLKAAAEYLGVRPWTVRQMCRNRQIPYVAVGKSRAFLIDRTDLDRYIERNKIGVAA